MSDEAMVTSATGGWAPGAEVTAQPNLGSDSAPAATGGDTPGGLPGPVPYDRFQTVVGERNGLRQQLSQVQGLAPWQSTIDALSQQGFSPETLGQLLAGENPFTDPETQFREWSVEQTGYDPEFLDPVQQAMLRRQWSVEQQLGEFQQRNEQAELASIRSELDYEAAQAMQQYPTLLDPDGERAAWALYGAMVDQGGTFAQAAELVHGMVERQVQARLAHYATGKQYDGQFPVVAGGGAPAPYERPNIHAMTPAQRRNYLDGA